MAKVIVFVNNSIFLTILLYFSAFLTAQIHLANGENHVGHWRGAERSLADLSSNDPFAAGGPSNVSGAQSGEQLTCTAAGVPCTTNCSYLDWWTTKNRTVGVTPFQQFTLTSTSDCFNRCQTFPLNCTAFSFNPVTRNCSLFSYFAFSDVTAGPTANFSLYIRVGQFPPPLLLNEWVLTRDRKPDLPGYETVDMSRTNPKYANVNTSWVTCLEYCAQRGKVDDSISSVGSSSRTCLAASFDLYTKSCSLYSNPNAPASVQPGVVALTHISVFNDKGKDNSYRFTNMGYLEPNDPEGYLNVTSSAVENVEACLDNCGAAGWNCSVATIRIRIATDDNGDSGMDCDIYRDPPKSFRFSSSAFTQLNQSYQFTVQPANSLIQKFPSYTTVRGDALARFPARGLNECWGKALSFPNASTSQWLYLAFDANLDLCSVYPPEIRGIQVARDLKTNVTNRENLVTFLKSLPTYNPIYYNYDHIWVDPATITFSSGRPSFAGSGPTSGQILPRPPVSTLEQCLAVCTTNATGTCAGVIHRAADGQCSLINKVQMKDVFNRDRDPPSGTNNVTLLSWQVFVPTRKLAFLENTKDIYSCMSEPVYNEHFSSMNQSNPQADQGILDLFGDSVVNSTSDWIAPHGPNFGGSPQSALANGGLQQQQQQQPQTPRGPDPTNPAIIRTTSFKTFAIGKKSLSLMIRQKGGNEIWPQDIGNVFFEDFIGTVQELGTVVAGGVESAVWSVWRQVENLGLRLSRLGSFGRLAFSGLAGAIILATGALGYEACHLYKWNFCEKVLPRDQTCEVKCQIVPATLRFLQMIDEYPKSWSPKMKVLMGRNEQNRNKNITMPWFDTTMFKAPTGPNPPLPCHCTTLPYPESGEGSSGGLKAPDFTNTDLQDSCSPTKLGDTCAICCAAGYQGKAPGPKCECDSGGLAVWEPEQGNCAKAIDFCIVSNKTWSSNVGGGAGVAPGGGSSASPGGSSTATPQSQTIVRIPMKNCQGTTYYGVGFQINRKIPFYSMYQFTENSRKFTGARSGFGWRTFGCTEDVYNIKDHQLSNADYTALQATGTYDKGHLTPDADMRFFRDSVWSTYYFINGAPQDSFSNSGPWQGLEGRLRKIMEAPAKSPRGGWVITGTCYDDSSTANEIPSCFWKIVCTKDDKGDATTAAFYHVNDVIDKKDKSAAGTKKKDDRKAQIKEIRDQQDLFLHLSVLGPVTIDDLWEEMGIYYPNDIAEHDKCKNAVKLNFPPKPFKQADTTDPQFAAYFWWLENLYANDTESDDPPEPTSVSTLGKPPPCPKRVVGYVTSWSNVPFSQSAASYLTHAIMAFVQMREDGSLILGSPDPTTSTNPDLDRQKSYARMYELRNAKRASGGRLKTMFAAGGWSNSQYFSRVIASDALTQNFVSSALDILDYFNMDGIDIDFEYPVTGGATNGTQADRDNYVKFLKTLRSGLTSHAQSKGRSSKDPYLLTIAGAAGIWVLQPGFDLPGITSVVDWINVMTYDYFGVPRTIGAWDSQWGGYTGPIAPLYYGAPPNYSGKLNVDFTMKTYLCNITDPSKIVMGLGFYGRFWNNSGNPVNASNPLWRRATPNAAGKFDGGFLPYRDIIKGYSDNAQYTKVFDDATKTPLLYQSPTGGFLLAYEDSISIHQKTQYAASKGFSGVMLWAVDLDDDDHTLLRTASSSVLCQAADTNPYKCPPNTGQRWWTLEDTPPANAGMCGKSAPLYKGFYPVCDPEDPGYGCCSAAGFCGSGPKFCNCTGCVDYYSDPDQILTEPTQPKGPVRWLTMDKLVPGQPSCGYNATSKMPDGSLPICNPDNANAYCCSSGSYCGIGAEFCDCADCHDFKKNPDFVYPPKTWIDSGPDAGKCGKGAPLVDGKPATCNPSSQDFHCCSNSSFCGAGPEFCLCTGCTDFALPSVQLFKLESTEISSKN